MSPRSCVGLSCDSLLRGSGGRIHRHRVGQFLPGVHRGTAGDRRRAGDDRHTSGSRCERARVIRTDLVTRTARGSDRNWRGTGTHGGANRPARRSRTWGAVPPPPTAVMPEAPGAQLGKSDEDAQQDEASRHRKNLLILVPARAGNWPSSDPSEVWVSIPINVGSAPDQPGRVFVNPRPPSTGRGRFLCRLTNGALW